MVARVCRVLQLCRPGLLDRRAGAVAPTRSARTAALAPAGDACVRCFAARTDRGCARRADSFSFSIYVTTRSVMLVGLGGNNGTTVAAGILANKQ